MRSVMREGKYPGAIAVVLYPPAIGLLRRFRSGQVIQEELPESHQRKAGTPTGGGIVFVVLALVGGLLATLAGHPGALPAVIVYLIFQRYLISGLTMGISK